MADDIGPIDHCKAPDFTLSEKDPLEVLDREVTVE